MYLAISIALAVLVAIFFDAARNAKLAIHHRILHIRYIAVTTVFVVVGVWLFGELLTLLNLLLNINAVRTFLYFISPSTNVAAGLYWIITLLCCLVLMVIYNLLIHLVRVLWVQPLSVRDYLNTRNPIEKLFNAIACLFYENMDGRVTLPPSKFNVGQWARVMRILFAGILAAETVFIGLYLQFEWTFLGNDIPALVIKSLYMLPVLSYILLEQVELFFAADQKQGEALTDTEEVGITLHAHFEKLTELYANIFGNGALIAHYIGSRKSVQQELYAGEQAGQVERADNPELFTSLRRAVECVTSPQSYYLNGLVDLINGKNLAVFDTPWGEFDPYYLAYIQHRMSLGETTLVLCDTEDQVSRFQRRFTEMFRRLNICTPVWRIHDIHSVVDGETDMLLCTEEQFLSNPLSIRYPQFNQKLKMVVMLDSYGLLCRSEAFFARIMNGFSGQDLQFIFFIPENNTDIRDELQRKTDGDPIGLCENPHANEQANMLFWREESIYKSQQVLSRRLYHDFGIAYTIAVIAAAHDVFNVHVLAPETIPTNTYYELVTKEYGNALQEDYLKRGSVNLSSIIRNNSFRLSAPGQVSFCIVYDENNNLLNIAKTWHSYGDNKSMMLHVVSAPYMLRDYFACNVNSLLAETTGMQMIIPGTALNMRAPSVAMLLRMRGGITGEELAAFAEAYGLRSDYTEDVLAQLLTYALGPQHQKDLYQCFAFADGKDPDFKDEHYVYTTTVTLVDEDLYAYLCTQTESFVRLQGAYEEAIPLHKQDVYNRFLPQQCVSYGNARYRIQSIHDGVLQVVPESTVEMEEKYTSLYRITELTKTRDLPGHTISTDKMTADFFEATVTREINEYFAYPGAMDFAANAVSTVALHHPITETKTVPCLKLTLRCPLEDCSEKVANTLCFLLKGAMETFLPKNHQDVLIFSGLDKDAVRRGVHFANRCDLLEDPIPSDLLLDDNLPVEICPDLCRLIPDVAGKDIQPNTAEEIHLYLVHYTESDTGVLTSIAANLDRILRTVQEYLKWAESRKADTAGYLRFGYERMPGIFDSVGTIACLKSVLPENIAKTDPDKDPNLVVAASCRCSFCGRPITVVGEEMEDGRHMCMECFNHRTTSRKEIQELLQKAIDTVEHYYSVTIPTTKVAFKSADSIREACGIVGPGRVLGFYNLRRKIVWIEKGGPEPCVLSTLMHELTHAWQHANIDMSKVDLMIIEGHTSYVEVECLRVLKQHVYADYLEQLLMIRDDEYGKGYRFWKDYLRNSADKNIFHCIKKEFGG